MVSKHMDKTTKIAIIEACLLKIPAKETCDKYCVPLSTYYRVTSKFREKRRTLEQLEQGVQQEIKNNSGRYTENELVHRYNITVRTARFLKKTA